MALAAFLLGLAIRDSDGIVAAVLALVLQADRHAKARQDLLAREIGEMNCKLDELTHATASPFERVPMIGRPIENGACFR